METFRKGKLIAKYGLRETFTNPKMLIVLLILVFMMDNGAIALKNNCQTVNVPVGVFEAFIMFCNHWFYYVFFAMGFIWFLADIPRVDSNKLFQIYRAGKSAWLTGEILHIGIVAFFYTALLLLVSIIGLIPFFFIGNIWSDFVFYFDQKYKDIVPDSLKTVPKEVFKYERYPYTIAIHCFLLAFLTLLVLGTIVLLFSIIGKKAIGLVINMCSIGFMVLFANYRVKIMWLSPTSHGVLALHHISILKELTIPLYWSYLYFLVVETILLVLCYRFLKKKSF